MPQTPAQKHKQAMLAKKSMVDTVHGERFGSEHEMLKLKLIEDKRELKTYQSIQAKIQRKADLLPHYSDWIQATLAHGTGKPDVLLPTLMLWHIDTGSFAVALKLADYILKHDIAMPDAHKRTVATVVAEEVADTTKRLLAEGKQPDVSELVLASKLTQEHDMPDQVRAKLAKAIAELSEAKNPELALAYYRQALALDEKSGVKTALKRTEKALEQAQQDEASSGATTES